MFLRTAVLYAAIGIVAALGVTLVRGDADLLSAVVIGGACGVAAALGAETKRRRSAENRPRP